MGISLLSELYKITISLNLVLISIAIAIFVFAVTLLGQAIEIAETEKKKIHRKQKENSEEKIGEIQEKLRRIKETGKLEDMTKLTKLLNKITRQKERVEKKLKKIHEKYRLFTVNKGVLYPASFLLTSIILTSFAKVSLTPFLLPSVFLWIIALLSMGIGSRRVFKCLKVIEEVSIISKEMAEKKAIETSKMALIEYEETKRPKLELLFKDEKPPFRFKKDSTVEIKFQLRVSYGDIAENVELLFFVPEEFNLPGRKTWKQRERYLYFPNYITTKKTWDSLKPHILYPFTLSLKTPSQAGEFTLGCLFTCVGFNSEPKKFKVIIE